MSDLCLGRLAAAARLLPALLACGAALGCGSEGARVSGKVTFKGQPVPAGKIYFTPDGSKGNTGATGYANIQGGSYDTSGAGGHGAPTGPVIVAIEGNDPSAEGKKEKGDTSGEVTVKSLFPRYETTMEVAGTMTKDFDVPAEAQKGPKTTAKPIVVP